MKLQELATASMFNTKMRKESAEAAARLPPGIQKSSQKTTLTKKEQLEQILEENRRLALYLEQLQKISEASDTNPKKEGGSRIKKNRFTIEYEKGKHSHVLTGPRGGKYTYVQGKKVYLRK